MRLTEGPVTPEVVGAMCAIARPEDLEEAYLQSGQHPLQAILSTVDLSLASWAGYIDGELFVIAGVIPGDLETDTGIPWLIASPRMDECRVAIGRHTRYAIKRMQATFSRLENYVHIRNENAIKWLKWSGFTVEDEVTLLPATGAPFHRFYWER